MSLKKEYAFPIPDGDGCGLTKLEYVSCAVLAALISNPNLMTTEDIEGSKWDIATADEEVINFAIEMSKGLLRELA
jgi:hypothetical protein